MATTLTPTKTWVAREGLFQIGKYPAVVFATTTSLSGAFASSGYEISSAIKNITVTPPETGWEKQDLLGKDTNSFQNQLLDEKPVGIATMTGTLILGEDETLSSILISGSAVAVTGGYSRYQLGDDKTSSNKVTAVVTMTDYTNEVSFGMEDARVTKWGDVRISGPDSHWEQDVTLICLAKNFYWEFKD